MIMHALLIIHILQHWWREADIPSRFSKNFHWLLLELSSLLLTFVNIFVIITFSYIKKQLFLFLSISFYLQFCSIQFTLSFQHLLPSLYSLSSFFSFSLLSFSNLNSVAMGPLNISRSMFISFVVLFDSAAFKENFNFLGLSLKRLLKWVETTAASAANENIERTKIKVWRSKAALKESQFRTSEKPALRELVTEQSCQVLISALTVYTHAIKLGRLREIFLDVFRGRNLPVTLLSSARLLELVLDNSQVKAQMLYEIGPPKACKAQLYFQSLALMSKADERKRLNIVRSTVISTMVSIAV